MAAGDDVASANLLVSYETEALADIYSTFVLVSYEYRQPPPWTTTGTNSNSDAVAALPNSGDPGPYRSNRDADRGLK